jgi:uncharacterized protein (UPF0333 family)
MQLEKFTKQPYEQFYISADFSKNLSSSESVNAQTCTATDKDAADASSIVIESGTISTTNNIVQIQIKGGTVAKSPYKLLFRVETDAGNKWELDVTMYVKEY